MLGIYSHFLFVLVLLCSLPAGGGGGGGYSRKFSIGVCCEGSRTLTLFKGKGREDGYPF